MTQTTTYEIERRQLAPRHAAIFRFSAGVADMATRMPEAYGRVMASLGRRGVTPQGPAIARYAQKGPDAFDVEAGFYVAQHVDDDGEVICIELPGRDALVTTHMGPYENLGAAYEAVQGYARQHNIELSDFMWDEYWSEPTLPPEQWRTEVIWPLT
jgi:AraC family transcriptional regulator